MPEVALHTVLRTGCEDEYEAVHQSIPRNVAELLAEHGVRNWRIWRHIAGVEQSLRQTLVEHPSP